MKLGIGTYTFAWAIGVPGHRPPKPMTALELLDRARQLEVSVVQICDNLPLHTLSDAELDELAVRATRAGIQLEVGTRGLTRERVAEYCRIARRVDAKLIRIVIDEGDYEPAPAQITAILRDCVPRLDGLTLGIENHDRFPAATLRALVESAGSERIGICLDTVNSLGAGEGLAHVLATLAPLTVNLHLKDYAIARVFHGMGFNVAGCPAGQGFLDVPALLRDLAPFNRCATAILELWTPPEALLENTIAKEAVWTERSLEYLRPLIR